MKMTAGWLLWVCLLWITLPNSSCSGTPQKSLGQQSILTPNTSIKWRHWAFSEVYVEFGTNIGRHVRQRVMKHLHAVPYTTVIHVRDGLLNLLETTSTTESTPNLNYTPEDIPSKLYLSFGNAPLSQQLIPTEELNSLEFESFKTILSPAPRYGNELMIGVVNGLPLDENRHHNISFSKNTIHYGAIVGTYSLLEQLGFAFLHPLEPTYPSQLRVVPYTRPRFMSMNSSLSMKDSMNWADDHVESIRNGTEDNEYEDGGSHSIHYAGDARHECIQDDSFDFQHPLTEIPTSSTENELIEEEPSPGPTRNAACQTRSEKLLIPDILQSPGQPKRTSSWVHIVTESPYWPERGFHIHTQHPLELTEVLQGHDIPQFGPHGPQCVKFSKRPAGSSEHIHNIDTNSDTQHTYCERWEDMVGDVDAMYEWSVANRLNKIEWLLLGNYKWGDELSTRQERLRHLTHLAHQYSLMVGADVPVGNQQQHGWHMVNVRLSLREQIAQIRERVDWIFSAGFDFMTTESGLSEFTHPECDLMVELLNAFSLHVNVTWGREAAVKVHCSTGQKCASYLDPRSGDPMNFNFLPTFAHSSLGIFPHTVQMYGLDDPTAGTYGNNNFQYVEDYLVYEAKKGQRSVMFYGETAYWVNVDIDVPLFLPLYGQRRQRDLRKLALRETFESFRMDGQMNFDSGWEWGYWLNDVVTARASWNPIVTPQSVKHYRKCRCRSVNGVNNDKSLSGDIPQTCTISDANGQCLSSSYDFDDEEYLTASETAAEHEELDCEPPLLINAEIRNQRSCPPETDQWEIFGESIRPFTDLYGPYYGEKVRNFLVAFTKAQSDVLIYGKISGRRSVDVRKFSGIAYLSGTDTWVDIPRSLGLAFTQPDKIHIRENTHPDRPYAIELLHEMDTVFGHYAREATKLLKEIIPLSTPVSEGGTHAIPLVNKQAIQMLEEIVDSVSLLSMRAHSVRLQYTSRDLQIMAEQPPVTRTKLLIEAREVIEAASEIVRRREENYRVDWQRIGSWRENPTVYRHGYVWAVHSLYFWWRDQGLAEDDISPLATLLPHVDIENLSPTEENKVTPADLGSHGAHSVCYLNRIDSTEVAVGFGRATLEFIRDFLHRHLPDRFRHVFEIVNCLSPPSSEYIFPRDI